MTESYSYLIAGLILEINTDINMDINVLLPSFVAFSVETKNAKGADCVIELVNGTAPSRNGSEKLLSNVSDVWGDRFRFFEFDGGYKTVIAGEGDSTGWVMESNEDFSLSTIYFPEIALVSTSVLSSLVMMVFGQACLPHRVILIHASAVSLNGKAYAFLGKSGTGKSTHSRLWLENISGTELVNDDNPAISLEADGKVYLYGTPWSGKTACYKNTKVQLDALVRLEQASYNRFSLKNGLAGFVTVMPSCTAIRWNKRLFREMNNTLEGMIRQVQVAQLECLPNRDAAIHCYESLLNINSNTNSNTK